MKIDATVEQIRALLHFAELNEDADGVGPQGRDRGHDSKPRGLPRNLVERYHSLFDAGRRPAIAAIEHGICSGCHIRLPTAVESQTRRVPAVHICPSCRRMLYAPELVREGPAAEAGLAPRVTAGSGGGRS